MWVILLHLYLLLAGEHMSQTQIVDGVRNEVRSENRRLFDRWIDRDFHCILIITRLRLDEVAVLLLHAVLARLALLSGDIAIVVDRQVDEAGTLEQHVGPGSLFKRRHLDANAPFSDLLHQWGKIRIA